MACEIAALAASEIKPKAFRTALFWPLALDLSERDDRPMADLIQQQVETIGAPWAREYDPLAHLGGTPVDGEDAEAYAEFVYFHDFVQFFLFRKQSMDGRAPPFFLFRRDNIRRARVVLTASKGQSHYRSFTLVVERVRLYVFRTGVALLVVELADESGILDLTDETGVQVRASRPVTLADVQDLNDRVRRAYAPYRDVDAPDGLPSLTPVSVVWAEPSGAFATPPARKDNRALERSVNTLSKTENDSRFVAPFDYWRMLLPQNWRLEPTPQHHG